MRNDYIPISCAFYDELEAAAVKKIESTIVYKEDEQIKTISALVIDFKTKNKEEFLILNNLKEIRLDKIISFNNIKPEDKNYC
jgi:Rho-binding antiterminator